MAVGVDNGIRPHLYLLVNITVGRVDDSHTGHHQLMSLAAVQLGSSLRQLYAVIHTGGFHGVGGGQRVDFPAGRRDDLDNIRQIIFALGIVVVQLAQRIGQHLMAEDVGPRVDFGDAFLFGGGVFFLHNAAHTAVLAAHNAAVTGGVGHLGRQNQAVRPGGDKFFLQGR